MAPKLTLETNNFLNYVCLLTLYKYICTRGFARGIGRRQFKAENPKRRL